MKVYYVGLDIHKKKIAYCEKTADGTIVMEGHIPATRSGLESLILSLQMSCRIAMEATMFTEWVYDYLCENGMDVVVANTFMMKAISSSKKKSDRLDARTIADLMRCNLIAEVHVHSGMIRELRRLLRFRNFMVRMSVMLKNRISSVLMETGSEYSKSRLHGKLYFRELMESLDHVPESIIDILNISRNGVEYFDACQRRIIKELERHPEIAERVERLRSIDGVGQITALTWALEIGDPHRFPSIRKAHSYCGLTSALRESAGKIRHGPLSKQRNPNLQSILIEASKLAVRYNPQLMEVYEKTILKSGNRNRATIAVARKLVAYLLAVDKSGTEFRVRKPV